MISKTDKRHIRRLINEEMGFMPGVGESFPAFHVRRLAEQAKRKQRDHQLAAPLLTVAWASLVAAGRSPETAASRVTTAYAAFYNTFEGKEDESVLSDNDLEPVHGTDFNPDQPPASKLKCV